MMNASAKTIVIQRPFKVERKRKEEKSKPVLQFPKDLKVARPVELWFEKYA